MARSTCTKCGSSSFEGVESAPKGLGVSVLFVQCAQCGGVVGVNDLQNTPDLVTALRNDIAQLRGVVGQVERNTDTLMRNRR